MRLPIAILTLCGLGCGLAFAEAVPLPRPRPPIRSEPHTFTEAIAGLDFDPAAVADHPTECDGRLTALAEVEPLPRLIGPEACGGADMVELDAVRLPDKSRIAIEPPATLNCGMAESVVSWLRDEAAPSVAKLGTKLTAIENYDSYECRPRNRVPGAKLSEHGHGDALDVRAFHLADGRRLELTDVTVDKPLREALRDSACRRFDTVLGPGADAHHNGHIHLDSIQRRNGYRICQWDVREPPPPVPLPRPRPSEAESVRHSRKL